MGADIVERLELMLHARLTDEDTIIREAAAEIVRLRGEVAARSIVFGCPECGTGMQVDYSAKPSQPIAPAEAKDPAPAVTEHVRRLVGKLDQWRGCMSHNESYFGEPSGLVKATVAELSRAVDPIYPPKPELADPLAGVVIHTATVPLSHPPSAPVGVEVRSLPALWRQREDNGEEHTEFDKGYEQASGECAEALEAALRAADNRDAAGVDTLVAKDVQRVMADGDGFWAPCSGCYETEDGHPVGEYPYSSIFQCALGGGCRECGGLGAVWDSTDYAAMAEAVLSAEDTPAAVPAGEAVDEREARCIDANDGHSDSCACMHPGDRECTCHKAYGFATAEAMDAADCKHDYRETADDRLPSSWIDVCAKCGHERGTLYTTPPAPVQAAPPAAQVQQPDEHELSAARSAVTIAAMEWGRSLAEGEADYGKASAFDDAVERLERAAGAATHPAAGDKVRELLREAGDTVEASTVEDGISENRRRYRVELAARIKAALAQPQPQPTYTTGHCENHKKPGGCPLHNLHCGWPECDRKPLRYPSIPNSTR